MQVHVHHMLKKCRSHLLAPRGDRRTIDQNIQPVRACGQRADGVHVGHIQLGIGKPPPIFGYRFRLRPGDGDACPRILKRPRNGRTDACPACPHHQNLQA
jgi:hypothetical protein